MLRSELRRSGPGDSLEGAVLGLERALRRPVSDLVALPTTAGERPTFACALGAAQRPKPASGVRWLAPLSS
eukprot:7850849-Alexandrium_andersonii.AAC.1